MEEKKNMSRKQNEEITKSIIEMIESGKLTSWEKCFFGGKRNLFGKKPYSILNQLMLAGDTSEYYATDNQLKAHKISFAGTAGKWQTVFFFTKIKKDNSGKETENGEKVSDEYFPVLRKFRVVGFDNLIDTDNKKKALDKHASKGFDNIPIEEIDKLIKKTGANIVNNGLGSAHYSPNSDTVTLPLLKNTETVYAYYKTLFHELAHWTGAESRLNRLKKFSSKKEASYAYEELTAELTSAMLSGRFLSGIITEKEKDGLSNSASYIKGWLKNLNNDVNLIVMASSQAQKAYKYILDLMGLSEEENETETESATA